MSDVKWPDTPVYWIFEEHREEIARVNSPKLAFEQIDLHANEVNATIESYENAREELIMAFSDHGRYEWRSFESQPIGAAFQA